MNIGIVGMPNTGKTTLFNALTRSSAESSNYQFSTLTPNHGRAEVADPRLQKLAAVFHPDKIVPVSIEFVDIPGLIKGSSKGQGLGNQFLGFIRPVDAIIHVIRCFEDENIMHVEKEINPIRDLETVNTELALADLQIIEKRLEKILKKGRGSGLKTDKEKDFLLHLQTSISNLEDIKGIKIDEEEQLWLKEYQLLCTKSQMIVANINEKHLGSLDKMPYYSEIMNYAKTRNISIDFITAKLEEELSALELREEREKFINDFNLTSSGIDKVTQRSFAILELITFFTVLSKEVHAWNIKRGTTALKAAGKIHTDMENGFIRAEVFNCENLFVYGSEKALREKGLIRLEGKNYIVNDGDVLHIRFNV